MDDLRGPYKGKEPELGWSLHMTGGWEAQLDRVRRWYSRASRAKNALDRYDFLYAFFENAFHLRDWLIDTGTIPQAELNNFFAESEDMRLCRDLANSHKHYSISNPSQPAPPTEAREYDPGFGNLDADTSLVILTNGTKHDAFDLAGRVIRTWEKYLEKWLPNTA